MYKHQSENYKETEETERKCACVDTVTDALDVPVSAVVAVVRNFPSRLIPSNH